MINIVKAQLEDAEELLKVKVDAFTDEVALYGQGPPKYDSLEHQIRILSEPSVWYYKILNGEKILGGICVLYRGEGHYYLGSLYIASAYQNKGLGTLALHFLDRAFPDAEKWTLTTPYRSFRNHHFYEKHGFVKTGETSPETNGFYLFCYEKNCLPKS